MKIRGRRLWRLPASAIDWYDAEVVVGGPAPLELRWEDTPAGERTLRIAFPGCQAYRVSNRDAMGLIGEGTVALSMGHLAEVTHSDWLDRARLPRRDRGTGSLQLRHFAVCLFDGPCFEFLADGFSIEESGKPIAPPYSQQSKSTGDGEGCAADADGGA